MVPQNEVVALHQRLFSVVDLQEFKRLSAEAGRRKGDYLLAHRIPRPVQWFLRRIVEQSCEACGDAACRFEIGAPDHAAPVPATARLTVKATA
jgi:hypothetical protein